LLGIQSDLIEETYFRPNMTWTITKDVTLNPSLFYTHGRQGVGNVSGNLSEVYDWYGGALVLSYPLMKKLVLSLNYRLTLRSSDVPARDYAQSIAGIKLSYQPQ
jgi:outer membrane protein assembly factor BamA